jgi:hypothetical protein
MHCHEAAQAKLNLMPRRTQLALALILLLVLAPLASATCGIQCLAVTPHHPTPNSVSPQHCVRTSTCSTTSASDITAVLATDTKTPYDTLALTATALEPLPQNSRTCIRHGIDSSPPGELCTAYLTPLRV